MSERSNQRLNDLSRAVLLAVVLLVGAYLRFTGLNWDEGQWIHPDEGHMRMTLSAIQMPDSLSLYFDTHNSPLNVRNTGGRYSYGTLPLFLTRMTAEWLDRVCSRSRELPNTAGSPLLVRALSLDCEPGSFTGSRSALVGRALSALVDLGTVLLTYLIGRGLYGEGVGLLAAALGALTAFPIQQAHFFTVDSMAAFFVVLTGYFTVRAGQSGGWASFGLAGLATGFAAACKVSAALAALLVLLAAVGWIWSLSPSRRRSEAWKSLLRLVLAGMMACVAFRVAQPYAFEGPGFFGLRPSPEWLERLGQIQEEQSGEVDFPSGRQWANRAPISFPWYNMVVWGMGPPLGLTAWAGWAVVGVELWRRQRPTHLILWAWIGVVFLYQATRWVKTMRAFLPLYPLLTILAAYVLIRLCRATSRRWRRVGLGITAVVTLGTLFWGLAVFSIYTRSHTRLAASRWIIEHVPPGVRVANEHWDWGLPLRVDGHDPFGGMYVGFEMQNYDEDTPEKREQLFSWLDTADYVFLASNRLYASISRLSARYPLTTAYYRALFAGELGFELVADFTSCPALGPLQFPDQEIPYPLMEPTEHVYQTEPIKVALPPAEEAFSVYDHPRVLIFRKTDAYSRDFVEKVLGGIDLDQAVRGQTPVEASVPYCKPFEVLGEMLEAVIGGEGEAGALDPEALDLAPEVWAEQQQGGTWSEMFHRDSLLNRYPGLAAVVWWAVVTLLGWLTFPLLFVALPRLRDRGYGLARVLGLLVVAYLTWLAASLHALPNTRGTILRMGLLLALVGGGVGWLRLGELQRFLRTNRCIVLLMEGLFALLYIVWIGVRLLHPDLWHVYVGGEKPMDFAYLNAVIKSTWFPPYNPWFAGSKMNYYYFGPVLVGTLIKLIGTLPAIAYNLAVPLLCALTGVGAFSVAYNLFGGRRRGALVAGTMGLVFTLLLGNLGVVHFIRGKLIEQGGELIPSTIPGFPEMVATIRGLLRVVFTDAALGIGAGASSWYWHPTRIIPASPGEVGPITEFPAFTFLYGDLHVNMIALPLVLLTLAVIVYWVRTSRPHWGSILIGGLVIGALLPTHTWDYPTYLVLALAGLVVGTWTWPGQTLRNRVQVLGWRVALLVGLTLVLYLPYMRNYVAGYTSASKWEGSRTPLEIYFWIHGIQLFPLLTYLLAEVWRLRRVVQQDSWMIAAGGLLVAVALGLFALGYRVALVVIPVAALAALPILVPWMPAERRLLWLMVGLAMALSLAVEVIVLAGDVGRMNTVFRFYQQVWILLSIAAAVSLAWLEERVLPRLQPGLRQIWWVVMALLVFGGALFLPFGVRARAMDRISSQTGLTLDGMAFMQYSTAFDPGADREVSLVGDYAAIRWLQDNVVGSPVILEGLGQREYLWANRVSVYTGLPDVVGWSWHQRQQRVALAETMVEQRRGDVDICYSTSDTAYALELLNRYGVRYVYVGDYERAYYDSLGLAKFDALAEEGTLRLVYDAQGVKIYEVVQRIPGTD